MTCGFGKGFASRRDLQITCQRPKKAGPWLARKTKVRSPIISHLCENIFLNGVKKAVDGCSRQFCRFGFCPILNTRMRGKLIEKRHKTFSYVR